MPPLEKTINLDKSFSGHAAKKFSCPGCGQKRFVRFFDSKKNDYLSEEYGRCDREEGCGYFLSPFEDIKNKNAEIRNSTSSNMKSEEPTAFVSPADVGKSMDHWQRNNFFLFIQGIVGFERAVQIFIQFFIGTAKQNGTIFWQVDSDMRIRTGQKIHYGTDGKRIKQGPLSGATRLFKVENGYQPCLFGLHQLRKAPANASIGVVESEKSAVIASIFMPTLSNGTPIVWMASSGSNGLTDEKIFYLRNRNVILAPDYSFAARATWGLLPMRKKLKEFNTPQGIKKRMVPDPDGELQPDFIPVKARLAQIGCTVKFIDHHPELENSEDIADHFLKMVVDCLAIGETKTPTPTMVLPKPATLPDGHDTNVVTIPQLIMPEPFSLPENPEKSEVLQGFCTLTMQNGDLYAIDKGPDDLQFCRIEYPRPTPKDPAKVAAMLTNPHLQQLISNFDLQV